MKTAGKNLNQGSFGQGRAQWGKAFGRSLMASMVLVVGLAGSAQAAPAANPAVTESVAPTTAPAPAAAAPESITPVNPAPTIQPPETRGMDLSIWGMYQHADAVVKAVMIGLVLASIVTWTILFAKGSELLRAKRRLRREQLALAEARSLDEASELAQNFSPESVSAVLLNDAQNELELSAESNDNNGIKERTGFRLERRVAAYSRNMGRGNGFLATIGAISPFVGLFSDPAPWRRPGRSDTAPGCVRRRRPRRWLPGAAAASRSRPDPARQSAAAPAARRSAVCRRCSSG